MRIALKQLNAQLAASHPLDFRESSKFVIILSNHPLIIYSFIFLVKTDHSFAFVVDETLNFKLKRNLD